MRKNIFDVINKDLDLIKEYNKLYSLFMNERVCGILSLEEAFNINLKHWKYKNTYINVKEILNDLELNSETNDECCLNDLLNLIELIKNAEKFCQYEKDYVKSNATIIRNSNYILEKLGYTTVEEDYKVILVKKDTDALETALEVTNQELSSLILLYIDFRIEKDIEEKRRILSELGKCLEPKRKEIQNLSSDLEDTIFLMLNKMNIRHNNLEGKNQIKYLNELGEKDLLEWYDRLYGLILTAIRLLEFNNQKSEYKDLKDKLVKNDK